MIDRLVRHAEVLTLTDDFCRTRQRRELLVRQARATSRLTRPEGQIQFVAQVLRVDFYSDCACRPYQDPRLNRLRAAHRSNAGLTHKSN